LGLLVCDNAESISRVVANSHVHSNVGLRVLHVQLYRASADREIGALLLDIVVASTGEVVLRVIGESTRLGEIELEMGEC
jgi:hypothetical protein